MTSHEGLTQHPDYREGSRREILILPEALDADLKHRLSKDGLIDFLDTFDFAKEPEGKIEWHRDVISSGHPHWVSEEANYLLYGKETPDGSIVTHFYFQYYNFFHTLDMDNPEDMSREDICESDIEIWPHTHTFLDNPVSNAVKGRKLLGTLHSHPYAIGKIDDPAFSPQDLRWNERYLNFYGRDGRRLSFVIYNQVDRIDPANDYYNGVSQRLNSDPNLLEINLG
jgi:hypothetical protein